MLSSVVVVRDDLLEEERRNYISRIKRFLKVEEVVSVGSKASSKADLYIAIGGDGTFLWASRLAKSRPVVGFKKGKIGFLATFKLKDIEKVLDAILKGEIEAEERTRLKVEGCEALNDVTVNTTAARMVEISFTIDRQRSITFRGDGIIVATPTGSTAYNLAAGGPIVLPDIPAFMITPLAPHTLSLRSIVVSSDYDIRLKVNFGHGSRPLLSADGIPIRYIENGEEIVVTKGSPAYVYTTTDFFSNLFEHLT